MHSFPLGQGHGIAGRYAGLPDEFSSIESSKIVILPVPFDLTTTYQHGAHKGPAALIEASRHLEFYDIETNFSVYQIGIHTAPAIEVASSEEMRQQTYLRTKKYLEQGKFVVILGGEHSISFAPIQAYAEHYPGMSVLQIDAHADLQEAYEGNPWSHASVMARVREIPGISSIVSVGIRSMSAEEAPFVDTTKTFFAHELDTSMNWIDKAIDQLNDQVYITFDLDGLDPSLMSSTGTPEPGGLNWNEATALLKKVADRRNIVGFDVVELCPSTANLAPDFLAAKLVYKILSYQHFYHF